MKKNIGYQKENVVAVIVSYNPAEDFIDTVLSTKQQVGKIIIVDNASRNASFEKVLQISGVEIIYNPENYGVARALNQGFARAIEDGFEYVLTLDQDSTLAPDMVEGLLSVYKTHLRANFIAVVGPSIVDVAVGIGARHLRPRGRLFFELSPCHENGSLLENVTFVITSGALCSVTAYREVGPFREDFFIDHVDIEYCLRVKKHGYEVLVNCGVQLLHRLGKRQQRVVLGHKEYPRFHSPLRWYYVSRNRIPMFKEYAFEFPHWFFYEFLNFGYGLLRMLVFEDEKIKKMRAFLRGTWDGLWGKLGSV